MDTTSESTSAKNSTASVTAKNTQINALHAPIIVDLSVLTKIYPSGSES